MRVCSRSSTVGPQTSWTRESVTSTTTSLTASIATSVGRCLRKTNSSSHSSSVSAFSRASEYQLFFNIFSIYAYFYCTAHSSGFQEYALKNRYYYYYSHLLGPMEQIYRLQIVQASGSLEMFSSHIATYQPTLASSSSRVLHLAYCASCPGHAPNTMHERI